MAANEGNFVGEQPRKKCWKIGDRKKRKFYCKYCPRSFLSKHLLAALALIIVHSIYIGQLVQALAANYCYAHVQA